MTPEEAKLLCKVFVDTIQQETETTKKVMRAVPEGKKAYKPESKFMSAQELAWQIATSEASLMDGVVAGQCKMTAPSARASTIVSTVSWYARNTRERINKVKKLPADKLVQS